MDKFIFKTYHFDPSTRIASFRYAFEAGGEFEETVQFDEIGEYDEQLLDRALFLAFVLVGTSYYKAFPSRRVKLEIGSLDEWQVQFFDAVYQEGLSQFAFENQLTRGDLAHFEPSSAEAPAPLPFKRDKIVALQSGGKDSILTAVLLAENGHTFTSWYVGSTKKYPELLTALGASVKVTLRSIDRDKLAVAKERGARNGHIPVTYVVTSFALIDAILNGASTILLSIGHEGEEAHDWIGDLPVNHQWSKTWPAEQAFAEYIRRYVSPDIRIGSPLRAFSELKIAELFVRHAWQKYGHSFSSCNVANYMQGVDNTQLKWCGECPKCANSFLLFAPFVPAQELKSLFNGQDLFAKLLLTDTFKGLMGIDDMMKPFECVGEIEELRLAYHMAQQKGEYAALPFDVPGSSFDYEKEHKAQSWARAMVK